MGVANVENQEAASGGDDVSGAAEALFKKYDTSEASDGDDGDEQPEEASPETETPEDSEQEQTEEGTEESEEEQDTEGQDEESKAKADDSVKVTLRVGDEDREVTLGDLKRGYMQGADYTRKTQELASHRKAFIEQATQHQQTVQSRIEEVGFLANTFMHQLLDAERTTDWNTLRQQNPAEYAARQHDMQERRGLLQRAFTAYQQAQAEKDSIEGEKLQQQIAEEGELLVSLVPEWVDPRVASKEKQDLAKYLTGLGVPAEELESLSDARTVAIARKAMLFDRMTAAKKQAEQKATKAVPKFSKPGPRNPTTNKPLHQKLETRARKSGRVEDFGASLASKYGAL